MTQTGYKNGKYKGLSLAGVFAHRSPWSCGSINIFIHHISTVRMHRGLGSEALKKLQVF